MHHAYVSLINKYFWEGPGPMHILQQGCIDGGKRWPQAAYSAQSSEGPLLRSRQYLRRP